MPRPRPRPRPKNVSCPTCAQLYQATRQYQTHGYKNMPMVGNPSGPPMKRIYSRATSGTYEAIGYVCNNRHVVLDQPPNGPGHLLTPTHPTAVLCQATGELVPVPV